MVVLVIVSLFLVIFFLFSQEAGVVSFVVADLRLWQLL